jgi:hypothetical protein
MAMEQEQEFLGNPDFRITEQEQGELFMPVR